MARSHSASKSLIYVINDLLDLTKTEEGQNLVKDEVFDLPLCIEEATEPFKSDAKRKGIDYSVVSHPGLPRYVYGDGRRVRQAISNVTANAVAHTQAGFVKIQVLVSAVKDQQAVVDFIFEDSGIGMSTNQLDGLFRDLEQVSTEESPSPSDMSDRPREMRTLGLGLAVVARIVRNMDGQLRLKSEEAQGSRFVVQLPFQVPDDAPDVAEEKSQGCSQISQSSNPMTSAPTSLTAVPEGEITLVDRGSAINVNLESEPINPENASLGSHRSKGSFVSQRSHMSDADRLIDAIKTPLSLNDKDTEFPGLSRSSSKGSATRPTSRGGMSASGLSSSPQSIKTQGFGSPGFVRQREPGTAPIRDTKMPVKAVKIPDEYQDMPSQPQMGGKSSVLFEVASDTKSTPETGSESVTSAPEQYHLRVLVAEDDPINAKILRKRLERVGHEVHHTVNGEDCAAAYSEGSGSYDVVLMDMQVSFLSLDNL